MKPVLLLVAGMLNDAGVWAPASEAMQARADVRIALPVQDSIPAMAAAAWALLDEVPRATPVVVAGFSLGGYVAIEMLARPRRPLHAAALISTSGRPETPEGAGVREKTMAAMRKDFGRTVDGIVDWSTHAAGPELVARLTTMMRGVGVDTAIRQTRAIMMRSDHRAALAALTLPVAVACGREDRVTPPALAHELAATVPGATLDLVDASGHMLPVEQPMAVARVLHGLLDRLAAGATSPTTTRLETNP
jgi:pimeloyl-ACP methyl ester carboxylesterase